MAEEKILSASSRPEYCTTLHGGIEPVSKKEAGEKGQVRSQDPGRSDSVATTVHQVESSDLEAQRNSVVPNSEKKAIPTKIPRSERRGLLARFCLVAEVDDPRLYARKTKWLLTAMTSGAAIAAPIGSAIILPSLSDISNDFHSARIVTNLSIALYMLALGIFPLWWSFFSEKFGRRSVYVVSFSLFLPCNILTAVAKNIPMLIVMRLLAGGAAGSVASVGAGTIADLWETKERGAAMGFFYIGPLCGPLLAPIIGGALETKWQWRSTAWFMVIYGGITMLLLVLILPETLPRKRKAHLLAQLDAEGQPIRRTLTRQSIQQNTARYGKLLKMAFVDPLLCVRFLRFPAVAMCVAYVSITFASLYVLQISVQTTLSSVPYSWTPIQVGCAYLFNSVGYLLSSYLAGRWNDWIMEREARRAKRFHPVTGVLILRPEDRMRENVYLAALVYPLALLWYGWAAWAHLPWGVVLVPNFFFGLASMVVFGLVSTMLTEFMPDDASIGIALSNLCRNVLTCIGIFVADPLLRALGNGILFSGLCVLCLAAGGATIFLMKRKAAVWMDTMTDALRHEK